MKIAFFVDGEENNAKFVRDALIKSLRKQHIGINSINSQSENKFTVFDCSMTGRQFNVALTINGVNTLPCNKRMIEDHLILAASEMKLLQMPKQIDDPKQF